jgi:hypothetical protein
VGAPALYVFSIPGSASDHRSPLNVKRDLKKMLRELGVAVGPERTEPPSQPLKTPSRVVIKGAGDREWPMRLQMPATSMQYQRRATVSQFSAPFPDVRKCFLARI